MNEDVKKKLEELMNNPNGMSIEGFPPFINDGVSHNMSISINYDKRIVSISYHSNLENETDKEKLRSPKDFQKISFPFECLEWFAPILDGYRKSLGIESGYEKIMKKK